MPTLIDSLLVTLKLDSTPFSAASKKVDRGLKDTGAEAEKTGKKIEGAGKKSEDSFKNLSSVATKFLAVIGGTMAIKNFVAQTIEASSALDRLSKNLGDSANNISAWGNAAEMAGGSAQGLQGTMDMLSKAQTELQLTGESSLIPFFSSLGVAMAETNGKARPVGDILLSLSERFSSIDRVTANNMGAMMGIDQGTMNLLLKGRQEVELMIARQKEYGAVTKKQAEEASRLKQTMVETRQTFESFGRELLSAAMPALEAVLGVFKKLGEWVKNNQEFVKIFLTMLAAELAAIGLALTPINFTVAAITALTAALAALYQDYQVWKRGGDSLFNWSMWDKLAKATDGWHGAIILLAAAFAVLAKNIIKTAAASAGLKIGALGGKLGIAGRLGALGLAGYGGYKLGEKINENIIDPITKKLTGSGSFGAWLYEVTHPNDPTVSPPASGMAGSSDTPTVNSKGSVKINNAEARAVSFFESKGWTKQQASGIVANLKRESAFKLDAVGDGGRAYGLAQWHPDRQKNFAKAFGKNIRQSSFEEQLAFIDYELTKGAEKGAGQKLRSAKTAGEAAAAVSLYYERPADKMGEAAKRAALANSIYNGIPGASQAASGARASARVAQAGPARKDAASSSSVETNIGQITINTKATDAKGIASDMGKSLNYLFANQANYGLM